MYGNMSVMVVSDCMNPHVHRIADLAKTARGDGYGPQRPVGLDIQPHFCSTTHWLVGEPHTETGQRVGNAVGGRRGQSKERTQRTPELTRAGVWLRHAGNDRGKGWVWPSRLGRSEDPLHGDPTDTDMLHSRVKRCEKVWSEKGR